LNQSKFSIDEIKVKEKTFAKLSGSGTKLKKKIKENNYKTFNPTYRRI
jgi:hypothetical protein